MAEVIRNACWDSSIPVNVDLIAEKELELELVPIVGLLAQVSAEAYLTGDLKEIDYDPNAYSFRLRFSIAHEIGHFVLHPTQIKALRSGSFTEWHTTIADLPGAMWGTAEYQAREFAGRLLVPLPDLISAVKSMKPMIDEAKRQVKNLLNDELAEFVSGEISKRFVVSAGVISRRLKSEKIDLLKI